MGTLEKSSDGLWLAGAMNQWLDHLDCKKQDAHHTMLRHDQTYYKSVCGISSFTVTNLKPVKY